MKPCCIIKATAKKKKYLCNRNNISGFEVTRKTHNFFSTMMSHNTKREQFGLKNKQIIYYENTQPVNFKIYYLIKANFIIKPHSCKDLRTDVLVCQIKQIPMLLLFFCLHCWRMITKAKCRSRVVDRIP